MSDGAPMLFEHGTLSGSHLAFEEPLRFLTCGLAHNGSALGVQLGFRSVIVSAMRTLCFGPDGSNSSEVHGFAPFMFNGEGVQGTLLEPFPDAIPEPLRLGFQEFLEWSYDGIVLPLIENRFGSISNYQRWRNKFPDCRTFDGLNLHLVALKEGRPRKQKQQQERDAKQQEQEAKRREASEARRREQIEADRLHEASQARLRKQQQAQEAKLEAKLNFGFFEEEKAKRRQQVEREEKERQSVAAQRKATERKAAAEAKKAAKAAETEAFRLKHVKEQ